MKISPSPILISDYDYPLPAERIAKYPLVERDKSKLLVYNSGVISQKVFADLPNILGKESFLVFNDTKVVHARLFFEKQTGSVIEIFCLEPVEPNDVQLAFAQRERLVFKCFIGNNKRWKENEISKTAIINSQAVTLTAKRLKQENEAHIVEFSWDKSFTFADIMQTFGIVPLPPYIKRKVREEDEVDYQTVYALHNGSVAAPTAGLHFTDSTFSTLKSKGINYDFLTLHVGAGTFKPVTTDSIADHIMHTEKVAVPKSLIQSLIDYADKNICCVGTTSVRTIESLYWHGLAIMANGGKYLEMDIKQWQPYDEQSDICVKQSLQAILNSMDANDTDTLCGQTQIIIAPGYRYRIVKSMVTNFHQPKSTLLLLVSAFIGENWQKVYRYALDNDFRFLSFGDACLFFKC
ncbi:MAG: S-adenosylmethionine:tRNA ribosyltransferase-isomerase [Bacteroidales bacterium]|jgi:S-adenosylmethionine:tRNA ribosyltransferase-isomerase|nr:S-adenosylmethionine:tRNA ribosyltransferase-isomerase [Bacteroidales bacterium]